MEGNGNVCQDPCIDSPGIWIRKVVDSNVSIVLGQILVYTWTDSVRVLDTKVFQVEQHTYTIIGSLRKMARMDMSTMGP